MPRECHGHGAEAIPPHDGSRVVRHNLAWACATSGVTILWGLVVVRHASVDQWPNWNRILPPAMRSQRSCERFFELLERVDMLHCGVERSISYEVAQLLVNLLDLCPGRVAYPIHEPESVEAEITIDQVFGRDRRELPAQNGVDDSRAASFERLGQLAHRSSAYVIEDEAQFLPVQSLLNLLV